MSQCTESCSEFVCCPLAPFRTVAENTDDKRLANDGPKNVPWYVVIGWTLFAVAYVTYQLKSLLAVAS